VLVSSESGAAVRSGQKGASPSIAKLPPTREERRDEEPDCGRQNVVAQKRSPRAGFPEGRKHPGCRDGAPLRGGRRDGDLGRRVIRKVSPSFSKTRVTPATTGCSTSWEEGSHLSPFAGTAYEWEGRPFARGSSAHIHMSPSPQPSSAQPTVGFMMSPRTRRHEERWSPALHSQAGLHRFGEGVVDVVWLAARPLSKGKGAIAHLARRKSARGRRGLTQRRRAKTPPTPRPKRGWVRSRSCSRVVKS
jgi:hypothetical protein